MYSENLARYAMAFASLAYADPDDIDTWDAGRYTEGLKGIEDISTIKDNGLYNV